MMQKELFRSTRISQLSYHAGHPQERQARELQNL